MFQFGCDLNSGLPPVRESTRMFRGDGKCLSGAALCPTAEQLVKDAPELGVEDGVDDGVDGAVDIAEPRHHGDEGGADVAGLAEHLGDVDDEERRPAGQKDA